MTTNEPPNQLEWFIRARSGIDSGQWDWGINKTVFLHIILHMYVTFTSRTHFYSHKIYNMS